MREEALPAFADLILSLSKLEVQEANIMIEKTKNNFFIILDFILVVKEKGGLNRP